MIYPAGQLPEAEGEKLVIGPKDEFRLALPLAFFQTPD